MAKLYHYNDGKGLLGILQQKELWLTHVAFLNDSQEVTYSKRLFRETLEEMVKSSDAGKCAHAEEALYWLNALRDALAKSDQFPEETQDGANFFVASLSAKEDDLGQWRGYSNTGNRYCIEFDQTKLEYWIEQAEMKSGPVEYDSRISRSAIEADYLSLIRQHAERSMKSPSVNAQGKYPNRWIYLNSNRDVVVRACAWNKHPKFNDEGEWRIVAADTETAHGRKVEHRVGRSFIVPYVAPRFDPDKNNPVTGVWIGPCAHPERALQGVKSLVNANGWGPALPAPRVSRPPGDDSHRVYLHNSAIPYRDW